MNDKHLVIVSDGEGTWVITYQANTRQEAYVYLNSLREDGDESPVIVISTEDFLQV